MSRVDNSRLGHNPNAHGQVEAAPSHGRTTADDSLDVGIRNRDFQNWLKNAALIVGGPVAGAAVAGVAASTGTASGAPGSHLTDMERIQAEGFQNSMQLLALQQQMQDENRQFTSLTNVLRAKHDTAKAALNNVRS